MYSYTVTFGRNTADGPLSDREWATFNYEVQEYLRTQASTVSSELGWSVEVHAGEGVWDDEVEESIKATLLIDYALASHHLDEIRTYLKRLAQRYHQEAIALTLGTSELIHS